MEIFKVYDPLCRKLSYYTQINDANMFRISDSEGLIGIKKSGLLVCVIKVLPIGSDVSIDDCGVAMLKRRFPFLRIFVQTDGHFASFIDTRTKYCTDCSFEDMANNLVTLIREQGFQHTMIQLPYINKRNNVCSFTFNGKDIILFDDHRTTLDVLFEVYKSGKLEGMTPNLITFDYHEDCCDAGDRDTLLRKIGVQNLNEASSQQFWNFVDFSMASGDDDWISAAMTLDLVRDVVIVGNEQNHNVDNYKNNEFDIHHIYSIGHISGSIGNRGCLGDSCIKETYYQDVRDILQYHNNTFDSGVVYPFILDIDLDCFSCEVQGHQLAWPEEVFRREYVEDEKTYDFMKQLIRRASLITISREHGCCGGLRQSYKILSYLDKYFFSGVILK